jgi:membrane fusion protein (multidrug efflux system)
MRPLVAKAEISQQEFDSYTAAAKVAEAQLKAAQDRVRWSEQGITTARAAAAAARARVEQMQAELAQSTAGERQVLVSSAQAVSASAHVQEARANLAAAELNLSYTTIVAPADGVVTKKSVEPGQIVQPGQNLMAIIPLKDVWVTANFKETQLAKVHAGQKAEIDVDMYGRTIEGKVDSIAGGTGARMSLLPPENATGNFVKVVERIPVKIVFDALPDGVILRPGMNVNATIITK